MTRKKRTAINRITGVTYKKQTGEILRIWYGENANITVIDVTQRTVYRYSSFTRLFSPLEPVGVQDIKRAIQKARAWLETPWGSSPDKQMVHIGK